MQSTSLLLSNQMRSFNFPLKETSQPKRFHFQPICPAKHALLFTKLSRLQTNKSGALTTMFHFGSRLTSRRYFRQWHLFVLKIDLYQPAKDKSGQRKKSITTPIWFPHLQYSKSPWNDLQNQVLILVPPALMNLSRGICEKSARNRNWSNSLADQFPVAQET